MTESTFDRLCQLAASERGIPVERVRDHITLENPDWGGSEGFLLDDIAMAWPELTLDSRLVAYVQCARFEGDALENWGD